MSERVYLFDTTLRDGAQTTGVDFSVADKVAIAHALDQLGVDYVEGGWPGANPTDDALFNAPPAMVFMGDTGSLALGGALGAIAVCIKHEIVLAIVGGLFVVEALSVIIQVAYFKRTGRRVFLMAPIHHHFEKRGWAEPQIVIRFWIIATILALIGLATLKLR